MTAKERIYAIIMGDSYDRPAVTPIFMAWAANYIGRDYRDYYLDGDVLAEAQLAVTRAFNLDQISAISDPWREASAYGVEFDYPPDGIGKPKDTIIKNGGDLSRIKPLDIEGAERMVQRVESVRKMAGEVGQTHSVLGWIEGPLAEYADLRGLENALMDLMDKPEMFTDAAGVLVDNATAFAAAQIEAGADMIGIGDAAASLIGANLYTKFVLPREQKLIAAIHKAGAAVKLHICGNIIGIIEHIAKTGADVIDVDWMVPLEKARQLVGPEAVLCGNFDPSAVLLQGSAEDVAEAASRCIAAGGERFFLMPGCEVPPATPEDNIRAFCPCEGCLIRKQLKL
ncbi:MAG TPA: uroporphyrinogen decarboxylase family protein [Sedimentisphaerales bacterium]|nr:uroporphyrinogen decarboxylase family protein [Sedimentisphaerales bacterium]